MLCVLAVAAQLMGSALAGEAPGFTAVVNNLDVNQVNILKEYATAINVGGAQVVEQAAGQSNSVAVHGASKSTLTFNNINVWQTNALQQVANALNVGGTQFVAQVAEQSNSVGRRLLSGKPTYSVSFNNIQEYQKNILDQTVYALNLGGKQSVTQIASQSNSASSGAPAKKWNFAVNNVDITQINVITQLAIAINIGGTQTVVQTASQNNQAGK